VEFALKFYQKQEWTKDKLYDIIEKWKRRNAKSAAKKQAKSKRDSRRAEVRNTNFGFAAVYCWVCPSFKVFLPKNRDSQSDFNGICLGIQPFWRVQEQASGFGQTQTFQYIKTPQIFRFAFGLD